MDAIIPSEELPTTLQKAGLDCFKNEDPTGAEQRLKPPSIQQEPVNDRYTYQNPTGEFTIQYPSDCGQMWESQNYADTISCTGDEEEISTSVELYNLSGTAKNFADGVAAYDQSPERSTMTTSEGLDLEMIKTTQDHGRGPITSQ